MKIIVVMTILFLWGIEQTHSKPFYEQNEKLEDSKHYSKKYEQVSEYRSNISFSLEDEGEFGIKGLKDLCKNNSTLKCCTAKRRKVKNPTAFCNLEDLSSLWNDGPKGYNEKRKKRNVNDVHEGASICAGPTTYRVLFYGYDNGVEYELYQNTTGHLYQTFYVRDCVDDPPTFSGYACKREYLRIKTAVYGDDDKPTEKSVLVPATCTLQIS